jgi:hypothetical protein
VCASNRFGRFTKEFFIAGSTNGVTETRDNAHLPMLVYGDVDVVFMTTLKRIAPLTESASDAPSGEEEGTKKSTPQKNPSVFVPPGTVHHDSPTPSTANRATLGAQMTANQFIAAVQELAVRLYSSIIEAKTGTVLSCLPAKQRDSAIRAALDVLVLKKIIPVADKLGELVVTLPSEYSFIQLFITE